MRKLLALVGLAGAIAPSCYRVPEPDCGFVCGAGSACPEDYLCGSDAICHRIGAPAGSACAIDAMVDAPILSPSVTDTTPSNGAAGVPRTQEIDAGFDRPILASSVTTDSFLVSAGGVAVPGTVTVGSGGQLARFTPTGELPAGAEIDVTLTGNIEGAAPMAPLIPYAFSFTTLDDEPPTLATSTPMAGSAGVDPNTAITVMFSEPVMGVDPSSFTVTAGSASIAGAIGGSAANYTFTPSAPLPGATLVSVMLGSAIADLSGNALVPVGFSFTTE